MCRLRQAALVVVVFATFAVATVALLPGVDLYVVASGSMAPAIPTGSVVVVADTDAYEIGDVVTVERHGTTVTHRIVVHRSDGFVTKGDANEGADDGLVPASAVRGEVVAHVPAIGWLLAAADTIVGYTVFVLVPTLLLVRRELLVLSRQRD